MLRAGDLSGALGIQADLSQLPLQDKTCDLVYALTSFLVPPSEALAAFLEVARVLRPGGRFVLTLLERDCWPGLKDDLRASGLDPREEFAAGQDRGWVCWGTGGAS